MQDRLPDLDGPEDVCVDWNVLSGFLNSNAVKTFVICKARSLYPQPPGHELHT